MGTSKISVDLNQRTFDIEVPDENIGDVLEKLASLFDRLSNSTTVQTAAKHVDTPSYDNTAEAESPEENSESEEKQKRKRTSSKISTRIRSYQLVDLGLTQPQRLEMQKFFQDKDPKGQNDQVAVLTVKLKEFSGKSAYSVDDIHSAFKVVNKPTPRNLTAVLGNMKRDGRGGYADNKFIVNSFTEDHVAFHMIRSSKEKK